MPRQAGSAESKVGQKSIAPALPGQSRQTFGLGDELNRREIANV